MMKKCFPFTFLMFFTGLHLVAQWVADNGDGTYRNPVIFADYSDPDVIRADSHYYMIASCFNCMPGMPNLPVLHSNDLVNRAIFDFFRITGKD